MQLQSLLYTVPPERIIEPVPCAPTWNCPTCSSPPVISTVPPPPATEPICEATATSVSLPPVICRWPVFPLDRPSWKYLTVCSMPSEKRIVPPESLMAVSFTPGSAPPCQLDSVSQLPVPAFDQYTSAPNAGRVALATTAAPAHKTILFISCILSYCHSLC